MTEDPRLKKALTPKTDQLNSDDLLGGPITITVKKINIKDTDQQPIEIFYDGDNGRPYKPCKSMGRILRDVWGGSPQNWIGKSMTLFRDPSVTWAGMEIGGIRISHVSSIEDSRILSLTASKSVRKPYTVRPLKDAPKTSTAPPATSDPDTLKLKLAGQTEAAKGSAAYIAWKDALTADQKAKIKPFHSGWAADAKAADGTKDAPAEAKNAPPSDFDRIKAELLAAPDKATLDAIWCDGGDAEGPNAADLKAMDVPSWNKLRDLHDERVAEFEGQQ